MYMSETNTPKKPRAQRRRNCRKCLKLHPTTGYNGSLWYCQECAETLEIIEISAYYTSGEFKRYMAAKTQPGIAYELKRQEYYGDENK
jgi:hypothetical protein